MSDSDETMGKTDSAKSKSKKYFIKKSFQNKKPAIETNLKGFLCSCNNREKDCIKESYNLLNEYADKLYADSSEIQNNEDDISDSLTKELSELKDENKLSKKRFRVIDSGAKNFLFIRANNIDNPVELAEAIVKDVHETKSQKTRFLLRLIPIEITCRATNDDIIKALEQIAEKHFKYTSSQTFCVMFNHRNNNVIKRDEILKLVAEKIFSMGTEHKVDLKSAKWSIIVEVIKGFAFLSVIPDYIQFKKYNLLSLSEPEQEKEDNK